MPESAARPAALVADDVSSLRNLVAEILRTDGYDVTACPDGEEALSSYEPGRFALCVLDVMMPRRTGVEVVRALRERGETVPVVLMSSFVADQVADAIQGLARVVILPKPFDLEQFRAAVARALGTVSC